MQPAGQRLRPCCSRERAIGYDDRIRDCNDADLGRYEPWLVDGCTAGFVRADRVAALLAATGAFARTDGALRLVADGFAARSAALAAAALVLEQRGELRRRGELYPVAPAFAAPPWLQLDRGAVPWFGVRPYGVHLTGFVRGDDGLRVWVAVRAATVKSFPGRWDNTVAGGQPIGLSLAANLQKECAEEAGIPAGLVARAQPTATITYLRDDPRGLQPDTLFCYDLELPADFVPVPQDGEVERFLLLPARVVADAVRDGPICKPNCSLVWIDFLLRHGVLDDEMPAAERDRLAAALRRPLP